MGSRSTMKAAEKTESICRRKPSDIRASRNADAVSAECQVHDDASVRCARHSAAQNEPTRSRRLDLRGNHM
jgi:hypothetical protein